MDDKYVLLALKEADIRLDTIGQCVSAVDSGIHIGGAYSALVPLVALFYGGYICPDIVDPTNPKADQFVLSKGHSVAPMAAIYSDLGYFDRTLLDHSRSFGGVLNGHPGPLLPGVPVSTGPLGHGISISCGYASARAETGADIYCMTGDGELQEGSNWEGILYAVEHRLDNLCVLVDRNHGQSDDLNRLVVELDPLRAKFEAFGWRAFDVDGTDLEAVCRALDTFRNGTRDGRPTALILDTVKGFGGFVAETKLHKATLSKQTLQVEMGQIHGVRETRRAALLSRPADGIEELAGQIGYVLDQDRDGRITDIRRRSPVVKTRPAAPRNKRLSYDEAAIPSIEWDVPYLSDDIVKTVMGAMAQDPRVISIDSDLSNSSGLLPGVSQVDARRALNAGIAEAHMMNMGEAFAADGCNVWCSTFAVFFDARAMRRIAVSQQERIEVMAQDGWLSQGHGLDITFLAVAPNLESQTNGATHIGNDDIMLFGQIPNLKIIDICCPHQLIEVMKWIARGDMGLVYLRIPRMRFMRIYPEGVAFQYGKAYCPRPVANPDVQIVSSGRGVVEALAAQALLEPLGIAVQVLDMPSADEEQLLSLVKSRQHIWFCEQNNGYLYAKFLQCAARAGIALDFARIHAVNCCDREGTPRFIHSGTYAQIVQALSLSAECIADTMRDLVLGQ